jgi:hypothetical protein
MFDQEIVPTSCRSVSRLTRWQDGGRKSKLALRANRPAASGQFCWPLIEFQG